MPCHCIAKSAVESGQCFDPFCCCTHVQHLTAMLIMPVVFVAAGVIATCCALIHDKTSFYVLRLLLGVFESGAAPAMWYAVSQFYPQER